MVKNSSANAEDGIRDSGLIPGSGRSLDVEMTTRSCILAWEIPWTEEPGRLQSMGCRVRYNLVTEHTCVNALDYNL